MHKHDYFSLLNFNKEKHNNLLFYIFPDNKTDYFTAFIRVTIRRRLLYSTFKANIYFLTPFTQPKFEF